MFRVFWVLLVEWSPCVMYAHLRVWFDRNAGGFASEFELYSLAGVCRSLPGPACGDISLPAFFRCLAFR